MKNYMILFLAFLALVVFPPSEVSAERKKKPVTPYGDFCQRCGHYGTCNKPMKQNDAERAMKDYYQKKGLKVEIEPSKGRFLKGRVMDRDKTVDVIIFDRRTGRIRSIY